MQRPSSVSASPPHALNRHEYHFKVGSDSAISVSDDEQIATSAKNALGITSTTPRHEEDEVLELPVSDEDDEEDLDLRAEETRLRYERLNTRGRIQEIAYNNRMAQQLRDRERDDAATIAAGGNGLASRERSRSHSKSRSRPSTPMLGALFKRDGFAVAITRSQSPPVNSVPVSEKSSRRPSVTNLFKFKPISRSSSSKSIHPSSSASSSQPTSPYPSPLTPLSPLPFFLSPKTRRKAMPPSGEDIEVTALSGPNPNFGSPLTRTPRRPSPSRAMTLPDDHYVYQDAPPSTVRRRPSHSNSTHVSLFHRSRREKSPLGLGRLDSADVPALAPHLSYGMERMTLAEEDVEGPGATGLSLRG